MKKLILRGKELVKLGYPEGKVIGVAINMMLKHYKKTDKQVVLNILADVLDDPEAYERDPVLGRIVKELKGGEPVDGKGANCYEFSERKEYVIYGQENIEYGAIEQMETAMRLPVTEAGALMPDAHLGYGLPIGGVLATKNAIIPYAVGVDIGCRMCLSIYEMAASTIDHNRSRLKTILKDNTRFGRASFDRPRNHDIIDRSIFNEVKVIRDLKDKAFGQLGSSGGGNHFVEFGVTEISDEQNEFGLKVGSYLSVLSHSGSRGLGANIARHYTQVAKEKCKLPKGAVHLAWLDLDSEEGQEYWLAMNLAGDYASACHHQIHDRLSEALAEQPIARVENHHNFAWKEKLPDGTEVIVHRKGATPAGKGELGIIPGSMSAPGFIVRGKGNPLSINSASHGAGRKMSRSKAKASLNKKEVSQFLKKQDIDLIGGGVDEAPMAYKDIHKVMANQQDLVEVIGSFQPKIVRMSGE